MSEVRSHRGKSMAELHSQPPSDRILTPDEVMEVSPKDREKLREAIRQTNAALKQGELSRPITRMRVTVDGFIRIWPLLKAELEKAGWVVDAVGTPEVLVDGIFKLSFFLSERSQKLLVENTPRK